jgi:hypothetical protein
MCGAAILGGEKGGEGLIFSESLQVARIHGGMDMLVEVYPQIF